MKKQAEYIRPCPSRVAQIAFILGKYSERGYKYPVATMLVTIPWAELEETCRIARTLSLHVRKSKNVWYEGNRIITDIIKLKKKGKDEQETSTD